MEYYKFSSTQGKLTAELSFKGISWEDKKSSNAFVTDVSVTLFENSQPSNIVWRRVFPNETTPSHPWGNCNLCVLTDNLVASAIGNDLTLLNIKTGETICTFPLGNTPIVRLEISKAQDALFVLSQYQGFSSDQNRSKSNLYKISFFSSGYRLDWSADLHNSQNLIKNFSIKGSILQVETKNGEVLINSNTGEVITENL